MEALAVGETAQLPAQTLRALGLPPDVTMYRAGVHAEGTCFYHSLAYALGLDDYHRHSDRSKRSIGHNLRRRIERALIDTTADEWCAFWRARDVDDPPPVETVRAQLASIATWADIWAIEFTMSVLGVNLVFFDLSVPQIYCGVNGGWKHPRTVLIAWIDSSHFEPVVMMKKRRGGRRGGRRGSGRRRRPSAASFVRAFPTKGRLLRHLRRTYERGACASVELRDVASRG